MQESTTIFLSPPTIQHILENSGQATASLLQDLTTGIAKLEALLLSYHFQSRERVFNVSVDERSITVNADGNGHFTAVYMIGVFNACADIDHTDATRMKIDLDVKNFETGETVLTGELAYERGPDEL
ncbi:hypothetical protein [Hufsiella ginkgonis]|uniref:Uncharacterized protein n=1 Tax=Hufsiella ginkgonis TaxID=2695274 RepID=A0A7K1XWD7_9SPHI|nr:hypothetical protein [Hufsiella ginkgonis]MXV14826.1 hypothetical protein [Hufsiella ginkgonis]